MDEIGPTEEELLRFLGNLSKESVAAISSVLNVLIGEVKRIVHGEQDVLFCSSNGVSVIKCLHYDRSMLDGEDGPVIFPSSNPMVLLAAYSNEYIEGKVAEYRNIYSDPELVESQWQVFLNSLAEDIVAQHPGEEPNWESLLTPIE
jgi:hypothetical protein